MANPIRELVVKVTVDADTDGFGKLDAAQEKTSAGSVALGNVIADVAGRLFDAAVAAAKYGAALVTDIVAGSTEAADAIAKNAAQLGVSAEQLQRLSGAAKRTGTDAANLDAGVQALTVGLGAFALTGSGPVADAFGTIGLEADEVSKLLEAGDIEDALGLIGDAFVETADSAEKNAALLTVFGGAGAKLRPLLEQGSSGIKELGDDVRNVIADEDLAQFEALADANLRVEEEVDALKTQIAAGLAPSLEIIAGRVGTFIDENEELITQDLPRFLEATGEALIDLTEFVFETIDSWREFIREIDNSVERFEMDFPAATGIMRDALGLVSQVADDVGSKVRALVDFILDAVSKLDALESTVAGIRAGLGLDDEPSVERGAGAQLPGGGPDIVPADSLTPDNSPENLQQIIDSSTTSQADKQAAAISLPLANLRVFQESLEAPGPSSAAAIQANDTSGAREREALRERVARCRARGCQFVGGKCKCGGGGAGRGAPAAAAEPTVDMLIAAAQGAAGGGPSRVGGNALAGTILSTVDNSITINNGPVSFSVELPPGIAESSSPQELGGFIRTEVQAVIAEQNRVDFDRISARRTVGGG